MPDDLRVLLVDSDPVMLIAMERIVRQTRSRWHATSVTSARSALDTLEQERFDLVVTGAKLADMEGASLLAFVQDYHPSTMRVLVCGANERACGVRALGSAHRFLPRPCPPGSFVEVLERRAQAHMRHSQAMALVGGIDALPCDRSAIYRLSELVAEPNRRLDDLTEVMEREPVLTLKLLHLAKTPFFGQTRRGDGIRDVIASGGIELVRALAETACMASSNVIAAHHFEPSAMRLQASAVGTIARTAAGDSPHADLCFVAGVLHDIGKWVLAARAPETFDAIVARSRVEGVSYEEAERREGGPPHAIIGAALLELWGQPRLLVDAVLKQDDAHYESEYMDPTAALRLAKRRLAVPPVRSAA